ncbi:MAG: hypothetical protein NC403_08760 [Muribaculaceae bacterium]|nr:hypothetical protein [Muribaculaceae bacterium]
MEKARFIFIVPRIQLSDIFSRLEAEDTPEHEARVRRFTDAIKPGCYCEVEIKTAKANYRFFADAVGGA